MNQLQYDFIRARNDSILRSFLLENKIRAARPSRLGLRVRFLFLVSDLLLGLGAWIRPREIRVFIHGSGLEDCTPLTNCT